MHGRSGCRADDVGEALLVEAGAGRCIGEGVQVDVASAHRAHRHDDGRTVDAAGQAGADRYVAAQMQAHAVQQKIAQPACRFVERDLAVLLSGQLPIAPLGRRARPIELDLHHGRGRKLAHVRKQGFAADVGEAVHQILVERLRSDLARHERQQGFHFRCECEALRPHDIIERLDPETVAHEREPPRPPIDDDEGIHSDQAVERGLRPSAPRPRAGPRCRRWNGSARRSLRAPGAARGSCRSRR